MQEDKKQENLALKMYGKECTLNREEFIKKFNVKENGLSSNDAEILLHNLGYNEIKQAKPKKWYNYFFSSLFSPFNAILLGIVFILIYTDVLLPETPSYANIIVIIALVLTSTFLEFFEEYRSNKAAQKLNLSQPPLSRALMDLEEELGCQLMIRGKRQITLTPEGLALRRRGEQMLSLMDSHLKSTIVEIRCFFLF